MPREIRENQNYRARLLKLIPSEIVAAYMVLAGIIPEDSAKWGTLIVSIVLLVLVPFYLSRFQDVKRASQLVVTMISFVSLLTEKFVVLLSNPFLIKQSHGHLGRWIQCYF